MEPPPAPRVSTWIIGTPIRWRRKSTSLLKLVRPALVRVMSNEVPPMSTVMTLSMPNGRATASPAWGAEAGPELIALTARSRIRWPGARPPLDWK
ncbi:hypothetical protein D3C79_881750 [compost metagenome]